ncbi:MAG: helix-turn-helix domain-containing protein [Terracidiphilus sp.]
MSTTNKTRQIFLFTGVSPSTTYRLRILASISLPHKFALMSTTRCSHVNVANVCTILITVSHINTFALLTRVGARCDISTVRSKDFEKNFYSVFGAMLADARRKRRVSQEALAEELDLTRTSITNIEKGRQPIQLHSLYLVAQSLSVEVKDLLPSPAALRMVQPATNLSVSNAEWLKTMDLKMPQGAVKNGKDRGTGKTIARK